MSLTNPSRDHVFGRTLMTGARITGLLSIVGALAGACADVQDGPESPSLPPTIEEAIGTHVLPLATALAEVGGFPSLQLSIGLEGAMWSTALGVTDVSSRSPADATSQYRIASLAKLLTGTTLGRMVEEGTVQLDASLADLGMSVPEAWREITVRQLAQHTSGIPHYTTGEDWVNRVHYTSATEALPSLTHLSLAHAPGTENTYSSWGYTVLAAAMEASSGRAIDALIARYVTEPLGMASTVPDDPTVELPHRTPFYERVEGELVPARESDLSDRLAGSGYLSTTEDLVRFGLAHAASGTFAGLVPLLIRPAVLPDGTRTDDGLGWGERRDPNDRRTLWGNGHTPGGTSGLLIYPEANLALAGLSNSNGVPLERGDFEAFALPILAALNGIPARPTAELRLLPAELTAIVESSGASFSFALSDVAGGDMADDPATGSAATGGFLATLSGGGVSGPVVDAYVLDGELWLMPVISAIGVLPLRLRCDGGKLVGEAQRIGTTLEAEAPDRLVASGLGRSIGCAPGR